MSDRVDPSGDLRSSLLAIVGRGSSSIADDEFDSLALAVFRRQYAGNEIYRAYCDRRAASPDNIKYWKEIPAVPTDAFKSAALICGDPANAVAIFKTSGTTGGTDRRGKHYFLDLSLYNAALRASFQRHLLPRGGRMRIVSLVPPPENARDSSLSHMVGEVIAEFGDPASSYFADTEGLDAAGLIGALRSAERAGEPLLLLGTSLAFVSLLDTVSDAGDPLRLPPGSRLMDTGGFKGLRRQVNRVSLYHGFDRWLGIPVEWCVNEYGMTEMSSQFYDAVAGDGKSLDRRHYSFPPWVRTVACDPESLEPLANGETGVLRHCDLANMDSVVAVQTADLGRVTDAGMELFGRASGAEARGCSLAAEELLSSHTLGKARY